MSLSDFISQPIILTQIKKCKKCGEVKPITEFRKQGKNIRTECKSCEKEYKKNNKEYNKEYQKKYRKNNKESIKEYNKEYKKEYQKNRIKNDPYFKFTRNLRSRINHAFKQQSKNGKTKSCKEYEIDFAAIYAHVGEKPSPKHHLDHIIPLSVFNLDDAEHVRLAHLPENLRWLPGDENLSKSDFIDWSLIKSCHTLFTIACLLGLKINLLKQ